MGPWGHLAQLRGDVDAFINDRALEWFDVFLRTPDPEERAQKLAAVPRVLLFDNDPAFGETWGIWKGRWRTFDTWPPEHDDLALALCSGGTAPSAATPWPLQGALAPSCYSGGLVPVAGVPAEATGPRSVSHDGDTQGFSDALDQRADLAATAFLGPELEAAVTLTGPASLALTAITLGPDADWVARIVDVGPEGARLLAQGRLRASHRAEDPDRPYLWHTHDAPELVTPGEPYDLTIEIWPTSSVVPAGHRLAVLLQTADTAKTIPARPAPASFIVVGPGSRTRISLPIRTEPGEIVAIP
jgi:hypothetical protein